MLNGTYRRVSLLPMDLLKAFCPSDIEDGEGFKSDFDIDGQPFVFEFMHEVYDEKLRIGESEITDRDLNVFFADKAMQSEVVAGWTDAAVKNLNSVLSHDV